MTAKDLKNAILQEAVMGKLVPQIASEGNARDLLEEIRTQKARLIKEGKIKKEKPLPEISEDEIPFDIPENWCWCRLGELGLYRKGPFGSSLTKSMFVPKSEISVKVYEQKNAIQKDFSLGDYYISKEKFESMQSFIVEPTDIIVSCAGTIGEVYKLPNEAPIGIINQALMRVKLVNEELASFWMMYFDYVLKKEASKQGSGTAIKNIPPFEILKAYPFPLPPLAEQKRIVAAIEKFMPLIEEYGKKETVLNELNAQIGTLTKKAILQEAVQGKLVPQIPAEGNAKDLLEQIKAQKAALIKEGKIKKDKAKASASGRTLPEITEDEIPFDIPDNWCWCRLGEIFHVWSARRVHQSDWKSEGIPFYRAREIGKLADDGFVDNDLFITEELYSEYSKTGIPEEDDLMITAVGTLGKIYIVKKDDRFYYKDASVISFKNFGKINSLFAKYVLDSNFMHDTIKNASSGTTVGTITIQNANIFPFPLPPLSEQKRIVEAIERMLPVCEKFGK